MSSENTKLVVKSILRTGANGGLGKECARQLALLDGTERIYLGCRNEEKAKAAKRSLEESTGRSTFEIVLMDVYYLDSVRSAVASLSEPIEALVMNAGGMGGPNPSEKTVDGVTQMFAQNVLGHVVLLDELLKAKKLTKVALYAGSEAARGVPMMGMKKPNLKSSSVEEFVSIGDGSFFGGKINPMVAYGPVKYMAAMWLSSVASEHPDLRFVTMSPGGTTGTELVDDLPPVMKVMFRYVGLKLMLLFRLMHELEVGARRYVDGLTDEAYKSGVFYASKKSQSGPLGDQGTLFGDLRIEAFQDNANEAIHRFINSHQRESFPKRFAPSHIA